MSFILFFLLHSLYSYIGIGAESIFRPIDLSRCPDLNTTGTPGHQGFVYTKIDNYFERDGSYYYTIQEFCMPEHSSTHLDAPRHGNQRGWTVAQIPLKRLIAEGAVIDLTAKMNNINCDPVSRASSAKICPTKMVLSVDDLEGWVRENGDFSTNTVLLVRFGWGAYYDDPKVYFGENAMEYVPGLSIDAAKWIAGHGGIVGVGVDTYSLDPTSKFTKFEVHKILFAKQIYGLENVDIPPHLPARNFRLYVFPIKLENGTGAPVRIVAAPN